MENKSKYKSVLDNSEAGLFENYYLTDLMIISQLPTDPSGSSGLEGDLI